jgi:uncharacterized protein (DUF934 family)
MDSFEARDYAAGVGGAAEPETLPFADWLQAGQPHAAQIILRADDEHVAAHYEALALQPRLVIEFPSFMDGRGFSHARKIRQAGHRGELLAAGDLLSDQLEFLRRCGFDGLEVQGSGGEPRFNGFTVRYQGS